MLREVRNEMVVGEVSHLHVDLTADVALKDGRRRHGPVRRHLGQRALEHAVVDDAGAEAQPHGAPLVEEHVQA